METILAEAGQDLPLPYGDAEPDYFCSGKNTYIQVYSFFLFFSFLFSFINSFQFHSNHFFFRSNLKFSTGVMLK